MVIRDETRGAMVGGTGLLMLMIGGSAALLILVPRGDSGVGMTLLFYGIILGMPGLAAYALAW